MFGAAGARQCMGDEPTLWPDWGKPATKGDVISAMVRTRSCMISIYGALIAAQKGDNETVMQQIDALYAADDKLNALIDRIGGKTDG